MTSLWQGEPRTLKMHVSRWPNDYQQLLCDLPYPSLRAETLEVQIVPLESFEPRLQALRPRWTPDWPRYEDVALQCMVEEGVLRQEEVVSYEDQVVWAKILAKYQEDEFWEKGLERYLADLREAMLAGALLPPAVVYGKRLVDGYHRTNAAILGGASVIPFIQANQ